MSLQTYIILNIHLYCIAVKFKRNTPMEWVDPDNWSNEKITQATPHVERIPCVHDTVIFSPDNSFSVTMPDIPINIGTMKYGNQVSYL